MNPNEPAQGTEALVSEAIEAWRRADTIDISPVWRKFPEGHYFAEELAARRDSETALIALLMHANAAVVAYSLVALNIMGSRVLGQLPQSLLERKDLIRELLGSFARELELGEFAREEQEDWLKAHK